MAGTRPPAQLALVVTVLAIAGMSGFAIAPTPLAVQQAAAQTAPVTPTAATLTDQEMERFLKEARIIKTKDAGKGITSSTRATLSDGKITHDAHIQTIDETKREFRSMKGVEFDFRDSWMFNVAGYKVDRLIGLNMVPVSVAGHYRSSGAAITWWVDDVMMDEGDRLKKKLEAPDSRSWAVDTNLMRLFDELIANTDRNIGNMLYTKDWRLWLIDHTRAFRKLTTLKQPSHANRCDRQVFERLKALDRDTLRRETGKFLDDGQIRALLARRDAIVKRIEGLGPAALFDRGARATTSQ